jgi:hypothetical protein
VGAGHWRTVITVTTAAGHGLASVGEFILASRTAAHAPARVRSERNRAHHLHLHPS